MPITPQDFRIFARELVFCDQVLELLVRDFHQLCQLQHYVHSSLCEDSLDPCCVNFQHQLQDRLDHVRPTKVPRA